MIRFDQRQILRKAQDLAPLPAGTLVVVVKRTGHNRYQVRDLDGEHEVEAWVGHLAPPLIMTELAETEGGP